MEFILLSTVVAGIANCVQLEPYQLEPHPDDRAKAIGAISRAAAAKFWQENNQKIESARRFSIAAFILNKALHYSNMPPQWMAFDLQKGFAVKNDTAKQDGIEFLTHETGWGKREENNYSRHFSNALLQGDDALAMPITIDINDGKNLDGKILRFALVGFDRAELVAFLDRNQIDHNLTSSPAPVPPAAPAETTPLPVFKLTARPLCVPPELLTLAPTTEIRLNYFYGANANGKAGDYIEQLQGIIDRQAKGFFTINEAAQIMADAGHGVDVREFIEKMLNAFNDKESSFSIRNPGSKLSLDKGNFNEIREYLHLVKSSDIDNLLSKDEVDYRFPDATPETQVAPVVAPKRRARKPSIEAVALDYMRTEYQKNQCFQSAAAFHKHLIKTAGADGSPFVMGTGKDGGRLFCSAASSFYDAGTLGKLWPKIRAV